MERLSWYPAELYVMTSVHIRGGRKSDRRENAKPLPLKMGEGAMSKECRQVFAAGKRKETNPLHQSLQQEHNPVDPSILDF